MALIAAVMCFSHSLWCCRGRAGPQLGAVLQGAAELALMLSAASSGIMGISVAVIELKRGAHAV
jgi:hypothetical protein